MFSPFYVKSNAKWKEFNWKKTLTLYLNKFLSSFPPAAV